MSDHDNTETIGAAIRAAAQTVEAPPSLRENLSRPHSRGLIPYGVLAAMVAAAVVVVLVIGAGGPSVEQVAAAALNVPTGPASDARAYGPWQPVGARTDTVDGRHAKTVIYQRGDTGAHYTVVDGEPLDLPGSRRETVDGTTYALATDGDVNLVAWHARGKTCVLASRMEDVDGLLRFATYGR